jgi:hypothetical protein
MNIPKLKAKLIERYHLRPEITESGQILALPGGRAVVLSAYSRRMAFLGQNKVAHLDLEPQARVQFDGVRRCFTLG